MMDTFVFHYLSDLNRIGGTLLDSSKASAAVEYFETALDILAFSRNHDCTKESLSSLPFATALPADAAKLMAETAAAVSPKDQSQSLPSSKSFTDSAHFVYSRAFVFFLNQPATTAAATSTPPSPILLRVTAAMIHFNLALSYQKMANEWGERSLMRALKLYDLCLTVIHGGDVTMPHNLHLVLATMNNMAVICYDLNMYSKVSRFCASITKVVHCVGMDGGLRTMQQQQPHCFGDDDVEGLMLNLLLLNVPPIPPAA